MVMPSAESVTEAALPGTVCISTLCAPVSSYWICLTPEPPLSSTEFNVTVTFVLFQPLPLGPGEVLAVVTGGVVSRE